jgi:subtilisin family serine protease
MQALRVLILILIIVLTTGLEGQADIAGRVSPSLSRLIDSSPGADSCIQVVVFMADQEGHRQASRTASARRLTRDERLKSVAAQLRNFRAFGTDEVESFLERYARGSVQSFWIVPAYAATLPIDKLAALTDMAGVEYVSENAAVTFDEPVSVRTASTQSMAVSSHLQLLRVPALWQRGLTGQGRLVCSFDTGVDRDHPALASKWRGLTADRTASWFSAVSPESDPYDNAGHGSHTMGVMVGSTPADTFGVAPGASWISAGVVDQGKGLNGTFSDILAAFQWALNPDGDWATTDDVPDVILNSWGVPAGLLPICDATFWQALDAVEAAGIVTIFAAGNEGPDAATIRDPSDRATTPLNSFCVGAVDDSKNIASFSSRGPSRCNPTQIKPEVVAPGVGIYSSTKDGGYTVMSGTSMAAPYIAGLVALCRQYNPDATVEEIKTAFILAAEDLGTVGEDNVYGHGLVNAARLPDFLPEPSATRLVLRGSPIVSKTITLPGDTVSISVELEVASGEVSAVTGALSSAQPGDADILESTAQFAFSGGATFSLGSTPFVVVLSQDLMHDSPTSFDLVMTDISGTPLNTVTFAIPIGYPAPGEFVSDATGSLGMTISDFGQLGLAPGSIYNVGGNGLEPFGGDNILYECGIVFGTGGSSMSSAVRAADGRMRPSDFSPHETLSAPVFDDRGAVHYTANFSDITKSASLPVSVIQEAVFFGQPDLEGAVALRFRVANESAALLEDFSFGLLCDLDPFGSETAVIDGATGLVYQQVSNGYMAIVAAEGFDTYRVQANGQTKTGFDTDSLYALLTTPAPSATVTAADIMTILGAVPTDLSGHDTLTFSVAFVAVEDISRLYEVASAIRAAVSSSPSVYGGTMPTDFVVNQNYPNPFNPTTTISFGMADPGRVTCEIFNSLGQRVVTLLDRTLEAGLHQIEWDATDSDGDRVASGVYFYRVTTDFDTATRKMLLLK